jgi:hypothetical protein
VLARPAGGTPRAWAAAGCAAAWAWICGVLTSGPAPRVVVLRYPQRHVPLFARNLQLAETPYGARGSGRSWFSGNRCWPAGGGSRTRSGRWRTPVLRPSRALGARRGGPHAGVPVDCPPRAPGQAVADLVPARARADGTPRTSGFGARPAPGDGGAARDTSPAAIRIRGRHLPCLISIATDVSPHGCRLPAGLTLRNSIGIGALGPVSRPPREGLDQWSSEDRAVPAGVSGPASGCLPPDRVPAEPFLTSPDCWVRGREQPRSNHGDKTDTQKMTWSRKTPGQDGCAARDLNPEPADQESAVFSILPL